MVRTNWQWWLVLSFVVLLPTKNLFNLPVGIMAIAGLIMLVRRGPELPSRRDLMLLFGVFGCIWIPMVMSLPGATNLEHSATTTLKFLRFAFMGVFMLVALRDQRARNYLLWGLFCIALFWCLDALWQLLSGKNFFGYPLQGPRLNGVFHPKYRLGVVLAALMPLYLELVRQLMRRTGAALLLVPPVVVVIILSGSRAGWIMLILGLFLYALYLLVSVGSRVLFSPRGLTASGLAVVLTVLAINHFPPTANRAKEVLDLFSGDIEVIDVATKRRVSIWIPAISIAQSNWLNGIGPRGFRYEFLSSTDKDNFWMKRDSPGVTHPHMHLLEVMTETGLIGLTGYGIFFVILIRLSWRQRAGPTLLTPLTLCVLVATFPISVHMAFYASFWSSLCWWLVFLALAAGSEKPSGLMLADQGGVEI